MTSLEDIKNGASVAGVVPNQTVEAVSVEWIGDQAINLVYRDSGRHRFGDDALSR